MSVPLNRGPQLKKYWACMALAQFLTWSGTIVALLLVHDATSKSAISATVHKGMQ
jgi:hypothetical protein